MSKNSEYEFYAYIKIYRGATIMKGGYKSFASAADNMSQLKEAYGDNSMESIGIVRCNDGMPWKHIGEIQNE